MSWQDRISEAIYLTSPSGVTYEASWAGDQRKGEHKVGIFEYPNARGAVVQDLKAGPTRIPMTVYFDGPDHDLTADQFYAACTETGVWRIEHPQHGPLTLQLVSYEQDVQPVTQGNVSSFTLDWIEPGVDLAALPSAAELAVTITYQCDKVQDKTTSQMERGVRPGSTLADLINKVIGIITTAMAIRDRLMGILATVAAIRATVLGVIKGVVGFVASLASLVRTLINLPASIMRDLKARFGYYKTLITGAKNDLAPLLPTTAGLNAAAIHEFVASEALVGMVRSVLDVDPATREEALWAASELRTAFAGMTADLDANQTLYIGNPIDRQVFSQSESYNDMLALVNTAIDYLMRKSFDLSAVRYVTLTVPRCPVEIAITEDMDLDRFIAANNLHGDEVLLLPAGRTVAVYA